jgi:hypothetical protein
VEHRYHRNDVEEYESDNIGNNGAGRKLGRGIEIGSHGESHREHHNEQEDAAIPGEEYLKIGECLIAALRGQLVFFVR